MRHIATEEGSDGLKVKWLTGGDDIFQMLFSRCVLGVSLQEKPHAVILGERVYHRARGMMRSYVALEAVEEVLPQQLITHLVRLKDDYRASILYTVDRPSHLIDSLRQAQGLSWYAPGTPIHVAQALFPSFVSFDTKCGINAFSYPDEEIVHKEIQDALEVKLVDPETGVDFKDREGGIVPKILFPDEFHVRDTQAGVRRAVWSPCVALYAALKGLDGSRPPDNSEEDKWEHQGDPTTGY